MVPYLILRIITLPYPNQERSLLTLPRTTLHYPTLLYPTLLYLSCPTYLPTHPTLPCQFHYHSLSENPHTKIRARYFEIALALLFTYGFRGLDLPSLLFFCIKLLRLISLGVSKGTY